MKDIDTLLKEVKRIHFIGIGGSGMCPLAEILLSLGYQLSGSDNNDTETFRRIEKEGAKVYLGQTKANLTPDIQLVIYTNAILEGNEELEWAKTHYPCFERAELLGAMSRIFSNCIGISGTHGKTTTSSMTTQVLLEAGWTPAPSSAVSCLPLTPTAATATAKTLYVKVANTTTPFCTWIRTLRWC